MGGSENTSETGVSIAAKDLAFKVPVTGKCPSELLHEGFVVISMAHDKNFGNIVECSGILNDWKRFTEMPQLNFWIAPEFGGRVVKTTFSYKSRRSVYFVKKLGLKSGIWFPLEEGVERYRIENGVETLISKSKIVISDFSPNTVLDKDIAFSYKPGDRVHDLASASHFRVGANGDRIYKDLQDKDTRPNYFVGWLYMASVTSLLVLTVGAYVKWKRK